MLPNRSIPIFDDDQPDDWHTFIYKASTGSIKAADTLNYANMAYMVAFTGDADSPNCMHLDDYDAMVRERFLKQSPVSSIQHCYELALKNKWIPSPFSLSETPFNPHSHYVGLWGREPVSETELLNDAIINCLENWSPNHYIDCVRDFGVGYDSLNAVTGMLYLSLTWPAA